MHYGVESRTDDDARLPVAEQLKVFPKMALIVHGETNIRGSSFPSLLSIPNSCSIEAEADPVREPYVVFKSQDITLPRGIWNVFGKGSSLFCGAMWVCVVYSVPRSRDKRKKKRPTKLNTLDTKKELKMGG